MKRYEEPILTLLMLDAQDVLMLSTGGEGDGDAITQGPNDTPILPGEGIPHFNIPSDINNIGNI